MAGFYYPIYFFQLDSIKHGVSVAFSFYSVRFSTTQVILPADGIHQLVILNASNFIGRATSGYIAAFTGVINLTIMATISCSVLIFGMIGLNSLASVVVLGVVYGYLSGMCT